MCVVLAAGQRCGEAAAEDGMPVVLAGVGVRYVLGPIILPPFLWLDDECYRRSADRDGACRPVYHPCQARTVAMFRFGDPGGKSDGVGQAPARPRQSALPPGGYARAPGAFTYTFPCRHRVEFSLGEGGDYDWAAPPPRCPACHHGGMDMVRRGGDGGWTPYRPALTITGPDDAASPG